MNLKTIVVIIASGLYFLGCHYWYCCKVQAACYGCGAATESVNSNALIAAVPKGALRFAWANATPIITADFGTEKGEWLDKKSGDNLLEITGQYYEGEEAPSAFKNMGLARADAVRKLLLDELPDERIRLRSELLPTSQSAPLASLEGIVINWIAFDEHASPIIDLGDKAIILFPQEAVKKEANKEIELFIDGIAERVKRTDETVFLTGHTDKEGDTRKNLRIGENRAMRIRRMLRLRGVKREQIVVSSKGELEPIASNETENGRYQNRRIVLEIKPGL